MSAGRIQIVPGKRVRTWGGWYSHSDVLLDGEKIGFIQTRRGHGRTESTTHGLDHTCVLGYNVDWLVRQFGEQARSARHRHIVQHATEPHGRCSDEKVCVEPVSREEKCR